MKYQSRWCLSLRKGYLLPVSENGKLRQIIVAEKEKLVQQCCISNKEQLCKVYCVNNMVMVCYCMHRASSYNMCINQQDAQNSSDFTLFSIRCSTCFGLY